MALAFSGGLQGPAKMTDAFHGMSLGPTNTHCALLYESRQMTATFTLISGHPGRWPVLEFISKPPLCLYCDLFILFILPCNVYREISMC